MRLGDGEEIFHPVCSREAEINNAEQDLRCKYVQCVSAAGVISGNDDDDAPLQRGGVFWRRPRAPTTSRLLLAALIAARK